MKAFNKNKLKRGSKNVKKALEEIKSSEQVSESVEKSINDIINEPSKEKITNAVVVMDKDKNLSPQAREKILKELEKNFLSLFSINQCPDDYEILKVEAKFLARMANYSFLLMAQRLKIIKDNELYKHDGYRNFKEFIENEMNISRATVYKYLDIFTYFIDVSPARHEFLSKDIEYTKLVPAIPLLKARSSDIPKEEIRNEFIEYLSKDKPRNEIRNRAEELKLQYNLQKNEIESKMTKIISWFINKIPTKITEKDKKELLRLKNYIEKIV